MLQPSAITAIAPADFYIFIFSMKSPFKIFFISILAVVAMSAFPVWFQSEPQPEPGNVAEVLFPKAEAGFGINDINIFANYTTWTNSLTLKTTDSYAQVLFLGGGQIAPLTFIDLNGDGLTDALYTNNATGSFNRYAVFLNNGSQAYDLVYKCYYNASNLRYYGDCAG